ncbi:hypothetical protein [Halogeometricum luteum]|uniref:Uncharacterized protein n=1 Tax=Halogeometricum luteum TaxID=2950537 RepID=A0ABU2FZQ6_9EURY|nr:hypothetical protein [Halogeometricum sp. S3BR5-2]MDS0294014.1 hypothetical protein [Halogeometricum sp. S3BR5-2]
MLITAATLLLVTPGGIAILYPDISFLGLFTSLGFWIPVMILFLVMLFGFWVGQQSKYT